MGGLTNWRAHKWIDNSDNARYVGEPNEWYKCLGNVYLTVRPLIKKDKRRAQHKHKRMNIEVALNAYNRKKFVQDSKFKVRVLQSRAVFDLLEDWDEMIRDDMTAAKMYMKIGDDASFAMH